MPSNRGASAFDDPVVAVLDELGLALVAADLLGLARGPVVGDEHRHPRQRHGYHHEGERQPPRVIKDAGQYQARQPHAHHQHVLALARGELFFVRRRGFGDQHRSAVARIRTVGGRMHDTTSGNYALTLRVHPASGAASFSSAPTTRVSTPVRNVGCSTGANSGEWLDGTSCSNRPAAMAVST